MRSRQRRVGRVHLGLGGEAQDHLAPLGVGDHALHHAVEDEELLHLLVALAHQRVALAVVGDRQQGLERLPTAPRLMPLQHVGSARELQAQAVALRVVGECGGHGKPWILDP